MGFRGYIFRIGLTVYRFEVGLRGYMFGVRFFGYRFGIGFWGCRFGMGFQHTGFGTGPLRYRFWAWVNVLWGPSLNIDFLSQTCGPYNPHMDFLAVWAELSPYDLSSRIYGSQRPYLTF